MRYRVVKPGLYGVNGPIPVGTEFTANTAPAAWGDKVEAVTEAVTEDRKALTAQKAEAEAKAKAEAEAEAEAKAKAEAEEKAKAETKKG